MKKELDIVVLSDVHLGNYSCHAKELLNYLKSIKPKVLVLNGDFIDLWQVKRDHFPKKHVQVVQYILKMSLRGTKVYYITGNHDGGLRRFSNFSSGNIYLRDKLLLHTNNQKIWIFHGDVFDILMKYSPWVAKLGDKGYDILLKINRFINNWRLRFGKSRMSFAKKVKKQVSKAGQYAQDFEDTAVKLAFKNEYDVVICGHIHQPKISTIKQNGKIVTYLNAGDWVENLTALEYNFDTWSIYEYDETDFDYISPRLKVRPHRPPTESTGTITKEALLAQIITPSEVTSDF